MTSNIHLLKSDWKIIGRDPMLFVSYLAPFLILCVVLFLFPYVSGLTDRYFQFPLEPWFSFGYIFFLPLVTMLIGMVYGFILLDERDAGLISYLSVTPLGKKGYIFVRMLIPTLVSLFFSLGYLLLTGFEATLNPLEIMVLSLIIATEAPMIILFLGAFAHDKVEGIAMSKGFGILLLAMIIDYFFRGSWRWLLAVCPLWWVERAALFDRHTAWYLLGAAVTHLIYNLLLYRKFSKRFG
ncbi:MAG TPA: hypothetical protein PLK12_04595 [Prolixibacteraceae bacterium]|nr:hypothetical protein [Prolixibacteraceae bacterium]